MAQIKLDVNGTIHTIDADPDMPLLYALRNDLGLNNPHFGCGLAQCGACTVHINGEAVRSCVTPLSAVGNGKVTTLAGLGTPEKPHPIQAAYVQEQVVQCGYCVNGWLMTAAARLTARRMPICVPQRHLRPVSAFLISASVGFLFRLSSAAAVMIQPLMQ